MKNNLAIIILAAGKGTRMDSSIPKVLHKINKKTMIEHVIEKTNSLKPKKIIVVIGYEAEQVKENLNHYKIEYVMQEKQLGTGHAVMQCDEILKDFNGDTLILSGDVPLITTNTLINLYQKHQSHNTEATILSAKIDDPYGYGRIIKSNKKFISIVEEKDADENQKKIKEINAGVYIFNNNILFKNIKKINNNNNQSEYYLPDVLPLMIKNNKNIAIYMTQDDNEIRGANTLEQLAELEKYYAQKI